MDDADLDAAERLFAKESSIFEGGGVEGTWSHYREHHIGPELAEFASFKTTRGTPEEVRSADGSMAMVAWPADYRIVLKDGKVVDSKGTVTSCSSAKGTPTASATCTGRPGGRSEELRPSSTAPT